MTSAVHATNMETSALRPLSTYIFSLFRTIEMIRFQHQFRFPFHDTVASPTHHHYSRVSLKQEKPSIYHQHHDGPTKQHLFEPRDSNLARKSTPPLFFLAILHRRHVYFQVQRTPPRKIRRSLHLAHHHVHPTRLVGGILSPIHLLPFVQISPLFCPCLHPHYPIQHNTTY